MHYTICDFLLDIVQNSVEAESSTIKLEVVQDGEFIKLLVEDNGKGMDELQLEHAFDPFYTDGQKHEKRKVGLGIPFLTQALDLAGGTYQINSAKGKGTSFAFQFPEQGIDTPPLGDLPGLFLSTMCFSGNYELIIKRKNINLGIEYEVHRSEIIDAVGDLSDASALVAARDFLASQEEA